MEINVYLLIQAINGGKDPGAVGPAKTTESSITLEISKLVKDKLEKQGAKVVMSRDKNEYVSITNRIAMANSSRANIFVSIHCNSAGKVVSGTETWYHTGSKKGAILAKSIQEQIVNAIESKDRGTKDDLSNERFKRGMPVLTKTYMPAILTEIEFINNPEVEEEMLKDSWRENVSNAIVSGICKYFQSI